MHVTECHCCWRAVMTNTAKAGKFSSDRTIEEYATEIWKLTKTPVEM